MSEIVRPLPWCWIRGHMKRENHEGDEVRLATIDCPFRKVDGLNIFSKKHYGCTHPTAKKLEEEMKVAGESSVALVNSNDETFCAPVRIHNASIGKSTFLVIDVEAKKE